MECTLLGDMVFRPFEDFRDEGLLWAINRVLFHPRGYAVAFVYEDDGKVAGWQLLGDGSEVWKFEDKTDDGGFERFMRFMNGKDAERGLSRE